MSRPSMTTPPAAPRARWRATRRWRTTGWVETREASSPASGRRMAAERSRPATSRRSPAARAADDETVGAGRERDTEEPQLLEGRDAIALLDAQLGGAADDRLALGQRGGHGEEGQLVDRARHLGGRDRGAVESGRAHPQ